MNYSDAEIDTVRRAEVFDADWYLQTYPDVAMLDMDPAEHYLWAGAGMGRNPSSTFDTLEYWRSQPEAAAAQVNPVLHWVSSRSISHEVSADHFRETYVGSTFDTAVAHAARREANVDRGAKYKKIRSSFNLTHYMLGNPQLVGHRHGDPIRHFLRNVTKHPDLTPDVNFSMRRYIASHPELSEASGKDAYNHWLSQGRPAGEFADPAPGTREMSRVLGLTEAELISQLSQSRTDLIDRLLYGRLGEMFAKAADVEPLVAGAWSAATSPRLPPFGAPESVAQVCAIHAAQEVAGFRRAQIVLVINRPRWGAGRRFEGNLCHALANGRMSADDIVVIYTDLSGDTPAGRFPEGVREIDFASLLAEHSLKPLHAARALVELIRSFRADAIVNINSRLFYEALEPYGRALQQSERLFLTMFCHEQDHLGHWTGHPLNYFYRYADLVEGVVTDSHYLRDWFIDMYQLSSEYQERLHVLASPVNTEIPLAPAPDLDIPRRPQVFWAGRWDRQKRTDLVLEIAQLLPEIDFRLWGETVSGGATDADFPVNVSWEGRYSEFQSLPLNDADVWLYTSAWDGVPSQLLEVAMTGIPIVATLVGGTGEVISTETSWPVPEMASADAYVAAIREVLIDPARARQRAARLRTRLSRERTFADHAVASANLLLPQSRDHIEDDKQQESGAHEHP